MYWENDFDFARPMPAADLLTSDVDDNDKPFAGERTAKAFMFSRD